MECIFDIFYHSRFIYKFGTHIIAGVKMGGKDVVYVKQQHSSTLQPADVQKRLKEMADKRFLNANGQNGMASERVYLSEKVCNDFNRASNFNSRTITFKPCHAVSLESLVFVQSHRIRFSVVVLVLGMLLTYM